MDVVVFEDEHLLVVNKPAGMNTHSPTPFGIQGIYEWLKSQNPKWNKLAIIHRLDKETSGLMVFGKTQLANRSLTTQFATRKVHKRYVLLTDRPVRSDRLHARSCWTRIGDKYASRPVYPGGELAETRFRKIGPGPSDSPHCTLVEAIPLTGRTHQIRVHAAEHGFPILGDVLYGGTHSRRLCLHAAELSFAHPATHERLSFEMQPDFAEHPGLALRKALIDPQQTNAYRLLNGAADGCPGLSVDRFGDFLLALSEQNLRASEKEFLVECVKKSGTRGVYHKTLRRQVQKTPTENASPQWLFGENAPEEILIRENGLQYSIRFGEGYSVGLFLDQRENRRALISGMLAPEFPIFDRRTSAIEPELLNAFAYTCGFSVCAAKAGARVTSLDLSKKYLDWGKHNFELNDLDPTRHEFIFGDAFEWFKRLAKKNRTFEGIILDPPTFSRSKEQGAFQVEKDYSKLVAGALPLLKPNGVLFCSTNAAGLKPEEFLKMVQQGASHCRRKILQQTYVAQPPDFPSHRSQPPYLKTVWLRVQ